MARRRMFCTELLGSDRYLDLDLRTQMLYIQLNINADDEGFVSSAKALCRLYGCDETDLDALEKGDFIIRFESGVVVITDWLVNNTIRKDRSTSTRFISERCMLRVENGRYLLVGDNCQPDDNQLTTTCQPFDDHLATQNRLDKNREDKIILDQIRPDHSPSAGAGGAMGGRASDENKKPDCIEISKFWRESRLHDHTYLPFVTHYTLSQWRDSDGNPIRDWKALARVWDANHSNPEMDDYYA